MLRKTRIYELFKIQKVFKQVFKSPFRDVHVKQGERKTPSVSDKVHLNV